MFCKNCGKTLGDAALFCAGCGSPAPAAPPASEEETVFAPPPQGYAPVPQPAPVYSPYPAPAAPKKKSKKPLVVVLALLLVLAIGAGVTAAVVVSNQGYKKVVEQYFEAMEEGDGKLMMELYPKEYVESWEYDSKQELIEDLEWEIEWYTEDFGRNITISYEITEASKMDMDEVEDLLDEVGLDNYFKTFMYVEADYTIKGSEDRESDEILFLIAKTDDGWCLLSDSMILDLM